MRHLQIIQYNLKPEGVLICHRIESLLELLMPQHYFRIILQLLKMLSRHWLETFVRCFLQKEILLQLPLRMDFIQIIHHRFTISFQVYHYHRQQINLYLMEEYLMDDQMGHHQISLYYFVLQGMQIHLFMVYSIQIALLHLVQYLQLNGQLRQDRIKCQPLLLRVDCFVQKAAKLNFCFLLGCLTYLFSP